MSTLTWIVAGIAIYWVALAVLQARGFLPESVKAQGPLTTLHTKRGRAFLEWVAGPERFWRAWSNFGVGVTLVVMVLSFLVLVRAAIEQVQTAEPSRVTAPRNVLVIPGVNEFLPLSVAPEILFGLLVGLVVHEGGHGILSLVEDIGIESMGLVFFTILPIGAFVEPDEERRKHTDRGSQTRMFAAGVTNNFAITLLAFGLLFGPVAASIAVAPGAAIGASLPGSAAAEADIGQGDRITAVEGVTVANDSDLDDTVAAQRAGTVQVTYVDGQSGEERTVPVERRLQVTGILVGDALPAGSVAPPAVERNDTIVAVNGTPVNTTNALRAALANRSVATFTLGDGDTTTVPVGAYVIPGEGSPIAEAGAPADVGIVLTELDGTRITSADDLQTVMAGTEPGQTVSATYYDREGPHEIEITLGTDPRGDDTGFLGVGTVLGISGMTLSDFGTVAYPADRYLGILGGGETRVSNAQTFLGRTLVVLGLPVAGAANFPGFPYNFAGFTGGITNFYQAEGGPLSFLGGWLFLVANLLFWTGWINLNLGFFNCIPAFPLDGGHILRMGTQSVLSRLPVRDPRSLSRAVTTSIGLVMLASLLLVIFGQGLLVG